MAVHQFANVVIVDLESELPLPETLVGDNKRLAVVLDSGKRFINSGGSTWVQVIPSSYTLTVTAALQVTLTDAAVNYFGSLSALAPGTLADQAPIYIPRAGTVRTAFIGANAGTAGSNEAWPLYIRLNNATDTLISSVSVSANNRVWSNTALSLVVAQGDRLEIKSAHPTWVTNPANVRYGGFIFIETS